MDIAYIKQLTWEERATWEVCPICQAMQGEPCRQDAGIPLDTELGTGAHVARLINAPVQLVLFENAPQEIDDGTTPS